MNPTALATRRHKDDQLEPPSDLLQFALSKLLPKTVQNGHMLDGNSAYSFSWMGFCRRCGMTLTVLAQDRAEPRVVRVTGPALGKMCEGHFDPEE